MLKARNVAGENIDTKLLQKVTNSVRIIDAPAIDIFRAWHWFKKAANRFRGHENTPPDPIDSSELNEKSGEMSLKDKVTTFFKIPENAIGWLLPAISMALLKDKRPNIIYSSAPPFTGHLVGVVLKKIWRVPLICDFRDPWLGNPFRHEHEGRLGKWDQFLEKIVFKNSDLVIANTSKMKELFVKRYPDYKEKIKVITNGFDPEDFENIKPERTVSSKKILMVHPGSLYGQRNPLEFLRGLNQAIYEFGCKELMVQFIGPCGVFDGKSIEQHLDDLKLENYVELVQSVSHAKALSLMKGADILLLFSQGTQIQVPAKLYEYFGMERPILAICEPNSSTELILSDVSDSVYVTMNEAELIRNVLVRTLDDFMSPIKKVYTNHERLKSYQRHSQAQELALLMRGII